MFDPSQGLTYNNVLPACGACATHFSNGFETAKEEVRLYLSQQTLPNYVHQNEEEETPHAEYQ